LPPDDGTGKYSFTKKHCSAHIRSSEITWTSPVCIQHLLSSTNMLPSSTNSPGASFHQTHGLLLPSVHFGPPSAMLKTFGNVLTLLLTGPPSSLSTSSSCLPKKSTTPASYLQPPTTPSLANSQQTLRPYTANPTHRFPPLLLALHLQTALLLFFHWQNIQTPLSLTSHPDTSSPHSPSPPATPPIFSVFTPASESEVYKILSNCPNKQSDSDPGFLKNVHPFLFPQSPILSTSHSSPVSFIPL